MSRIPQSISSPFAQPTTGGFGCFSVPWNIETKRYHAPNGSEQSGPLFAMIEGGVEGKRPELRTVALLTAATSALGLMLPKLITVDAWPLFLALEFLTLFWAGYSFVKFGKRGWWVLALALPSLLWPSRIAISLADGILARLVHNAHRIEMRAVILRGALLHHP